MSGAEALAAEPEALLAAGWVALSVSVFDHWLTDTEAADEPAMFFALAEREGALER